MQQTFNYVFNYFYSFMLIHAWKIDRDVDNIVCTYFKSFTVQTKTAA